MKTEKQTKTTKVDPSQLAPDFENIDGDLQLDEHTYWLGVTADCPRGQIDLAGLHFPKNEEEIVVNDTGKQIRVPKVGTINKTVTRYHFEELVKNLKRYVIRPHHSVEANNDGQNIGDKAQQSRGKLIKIPTPEQIAGAMEGGRKLKAYIKRPGDRPASEFMYFVHAPHGQRDHEYQTISQTGLEWPFEIESITKKSVKSKDTAEPGNKANEYR